MSNEICGDVFDANYTMLHKLGMEHDIPKLLRKMMEAIDGGQIELAKRLGNEDWQSNISRWIKGAKPDVGNYHRIIALAEHLGVVDDAVSKPATNEGIKNLITPNRLGAGPDIESDAPENVPEMDMHGEGAGQHEVATTDAARVNWGIPVPFLRNELQIAPGKAIIVQVRNDSMQDALFRGDRAIINLDVTEVREPGIFALYLDDSTDLQFMHARALAGSRGQRILCSYGKPVYGMPFEVELANIRIVGRVAGKISRL